MDFKIIATECYLSTRVIARNEAISAQDNQQNVILYGNQRHFAFRSRHNIISVDLHSSEIASFLLCLRLIRFKSEKG